MPIYEYRCAQCGHKLESIQKFSDAPLTTCPACGKEALTKLVSAAGFQLKGSGWYQTDFRGGSKPAATGDAAAKDSPAGGDAAAAKPDAASTTSTESKGTGSDTAAKPATPAAPSTPAS